MKKFNVHTTFVNIVRGPQFLSIRNLNEKQKNYILKKYEHKDYFDYIKAELILDPIDVNNTKMKQYCDNLSKHRKFNWREMWNEFGN